MKRADQIRQEIELLQAELEQIDKRPAQPKAANNFVVFEKTSRARGDRTIQYFAVRSGPKWTVIGKDRRVRVPEGPVAWSGLLDFVEQDEAARPEILVGKLTKLED